MKAGVQIITIILLGLLLSCCATSSDVPTNNPPPNPIPINKTNTTSIYPAPALPDGVSQKEVDIWNQISKTNVEKVCLNSAKKEAGSESWAVRSCSCTPNEQGYEKKYNCDLSVLDPTGTKYFVNVDCMLLNHVCIVDSNKGQQNMSIEDLDRLRQQ